MLWCGYFIGYSLLSGKTLGSAAMDCKYIPYFESIDRDGAGRTWAIFSKYNFIVGEIIITYFNSDRNNMFHIKSFPRRALRVIAQDAPSKVVRSLSSWHGEGKAYLNVTYLMGQIKNSKAYIIYFYEANYEDESLFTK